MPFFFFFLEYCNCYVWISNFGMALTKYRNVTLEYLCQCLIPPFLASMHVLETKLERKVVFWPQALKIWVQVFFYLSIKTYFASQVLVPSKWYSSTRVQDQVWGLHHKYSLSWPRGSRTTDSSSNGRVIGVWVWIQVLTLCINCLWLFSSKCDHLDSWWILLLFSFYKLMVRYVARIHKVSYSKSVNVTFKWLWVYLY